MIITHVCNSFLIVESGCVKLACDPWVGIANQGGWISDPHVSMERALNGLSGVNYIYISHLHDDHFCVDLLQKLFVKDSSITFLVKNFSDGVLYRQIKKLGFDKVIELRDFEWTEISGMQVAIVPQFNSNSAGLEDQINYDIDTSILISADEEIFFNKVDNPIDLNGLERVGKFVKDTTGQEISLSTITCGAASEWPQCFIFKDRVTAKQKFLEQELKKLITQVEILGCTTVIPAGGSYLIPGKFLSLNQFVATASIDQVRKSLGQIGVTVFDLCGGGAVENQDCGWVQIREKCSWSEPLDEESLKGYVYPWFGTDAVDSTHLLKMLINACGHLEQRFIDHNWRPETSILFRVYENLGIDSKGENLSGTELFQHKCFSEVKTATATIYIDQRLLRHCLLGKALLNNMMSGSLTIQDRDPDIFFPGTLFALNYLRSTI